MKLNLSPATKSNIIDMVNQKESLSSLIKSHDALMFKGTIWAKRRREFSFLSDIHRAVHRKYKDKDERSRKFIETLQLLQSGRWTQHVEIVKLAVSYGVVTIKLSEARELAYLNR